MDYKHFIGIDVSKKWLDFAVVVEGNVLFHLQVNNSKDGISEFMSQLFKQPNYQENTSLFCMEHTGIYNNHLVSFLTKMKTSVCIESGRQIKQSQGIQRGKNDRVDAQRIALYAYKNRNDIRLWTPKREVIVKLKYLLSLRDRLINASKQLSTPVKEDSGFIDKNLTKRIASLSKRTITSLKKDIEAVDDEILQLIQTDVELKRLFAIITSIKGVGAITAVQILITTNEFKDINSPKKFACYCGVAPFEHSSGSSIRGKTRVSQLGNKNVKRLLHMAAMVSVMYNEELKQYYQRKVEAGKNKMLVLNAVRNKLIHRIFSCVKHDRLYENNYQNLLA
jgi:transposase